MTKEQREQGIEIIGEINEAAANLTVDLATKVTTGEIKLGMADLLIVLDVCQQVLRKCLEARGFSMTPDEEAFTREIAKGIADRAAKTTIDGMKAMGIVASPVTSVH